ncbi:hypothetical protein [Streptomyces zingiberis]|uniref:Uncharacterized protein n=1 Tax=Streptomyces zingiberis TaxID=2053010 RepID=A0ABX1BUI0_9ACTN|nr:hypothetical protein [Streptomyces zingiberis]NJP99406.1 hypothetical protein [Streptomyces zingiberis]
MSHHQPPPQPGPYGGGAPGPYGAGGAGGAPGYGYPAGTPGQAPPPPPPPPHHGGAGPYGQPQQPGPYGGHHGHPGHPGHQGHPGYPGQTPPPYGQTQQPYGQMPPPPPPSGAGKGKRIGIVAGVAVAVAAVVTGAVLLTGGADDDGPHRLTTPQKVAGEYERKGEGRDDSGLSGKDRDSLAKLPGVRDPHPVQAEYLTTTKKQMLLTGVWGEIDNPEQVIDAMFTVLRTSAQDQGNVEVIGSPEDAEPDGLGSAVMKCQKFKTTNDDPSAPVKTAEIPVCIWSDSSTVGGVMVIDPLAVLAGKADLEAVAEETAKVRGDARVKIEDGG